MSNVVEFAVASYHKTHRLFLSLVDDLTDEQLDVPGESHYTAGRLPLVAFGAVRRLNPRPDRT